MPFRRSPDRPVHFQRHHWRITAHLRLEGGGRGPPPRVRPGARKTGAAASKDQRKAASHSRRSGGGTGSHPGRTASAHEQHRRQNQIRALHPRKLNPTHNSGSKDENPTDMTPPELNRYLNEVLPVSLWHTAHRFGEGPFDRGCRQLSERRCVTAEVSAATFCLAFWITLTLYLDGYVRDALQAKYPPIALHLGRGP
jgi:hypothetical protein